MAPHVLALFGADQPLQGVALVCLGSSLQEEWSWIPGAWCTPALFQFNLGFV